LSIIFKVPELKAAAPQPRGEGRDITKGWHLMNKRLSSLLLAASLALSVASVALPSVASAAPTTQAAAKWSDTKWGDDQTAVVDQQADDQEYANLGWDRVQHTF
jgi:hypothetical protein